MKYLLLIVLLSGCASGQVRVIDSKNRGEAVYLADANECQVKAYQVNAFGKGFINNQKYWQCIVDKGYDIEN